ncbi:putative membrane protein [Cnuella takakiae]|uniref:Putative membrane protein n=1 Tax=Cnuella takakiae TaxID=1302690 RepID=A0A1M5EHL7_9BACT|nr:carotenoid biosynthesis protein [Cnuella takakiae]OLY91180.1 hypothetical protein BUE76_04160 [Cnuella takakiae]SHF78758.1 putative membrane protein [Cnuella takakiae]
MKLTHYRFYIAAFVLLLFYVFGFRGMCNPAERDWFVSKTPLNLVLTTGLFLWANKDYRPRFLVVCALIWVLCFFVEVAGVTTRVIFGNYDYGRSLGVQWLQVPLLIGANWLVLVLSTAGMVQHLRMPVWARWALAAALMVALDWVIEPIAMQLDFWQWENGIVPLQNYIAWYVVAFAMQALLHLAKPRLETTLCIFIYLIQLLFFAGLHWGL